MNLPSLRSLVTHLINLLFVSLVVCLCPSSSTQDNSLVVALDKENEYWQKAVETKLIVLDENHTCDIVSCPPSIKPLDNKFVFSIKLRSDGSIDHYKTRLVVLGNKKEYGLDYDKTFSPIAKMTIVGTILALAASQSWSLHQMDVNAFLHGDFKEEVYIKLPYGMHTLFPNIVCKLKRFLYGLKHAPRYDPFLFLQRTLKGIVVLLVYVDDIVVTGSDQEEISRIKQILHFHMKELGHLTYFSGLEAFFKSAKVQSRFVPASWTQIQPLLTLPSKCHSNDPTLYRKLVGSLFYVIITHPDIYFIVHTISKFMQSPQNFHFHCPDTRKSTIGWCMFLGNALISSKCKKQNLVSKSSTKAKYQAMSSFDSLKHNQLYYMVTTLVLYRLQQIQFTMNEQNRLKLIIHPTYTSIVIHKSNEPLTLSNVKTSRRAKMPSWMRWK
ncbi:hypothetical protein CR513_47754, partial [Mucuna pruriens]